MSMPFLLRYVAVWHFAVIRFVCLLGELVPLGGKHALAAATLHGEAKAADAGEEIDECEFRVFWRGEWDVGL